MSDGDPLGVGEGIEADDRPIPDGLSAEEHPCPGPSPGPDAMSVHADREIEPQSVAPARATRRATGLERTGQHRTA